MYIGIDLGGTNIAIGIVNAERKIIISDSCPTKAPRPCNEIVADMANLTNNLLKRKGISISEIKGIGIGTPGAVDNKNGIVLRAENLGWLNVDLKGELRKYFPSTHISIENDANAAAYGEYLENGNGKDNFIAVTLGTGVGGGIIINKQIYRGLNGAAGELGHITLIENGIKCSCDNNGCLEAYASATALIRQTKEAIEAHPETIMAKAEKITGKTPFDAAKAGDKVAEQVVNQYIEHLACGLTTIINIFVPDVLVIGGGISYQGDVLLNPIKDYLKEHIFCKDGPQTEVKIATLKNDAGIVGAALSSAV